MEKQLLALFLELYVLNDKIDTWSIEKFRDNPPSLYRLQMINSYMQALEIKGTYLEFIQGAFITNIQLDKWGDFKIKIKKMLPANQEYLDSRLPMKVSDISSIFQILMQYRLNAALLLSSNDGIYTASGEFRTFVNLMNNINRKLFRDLKKIDMVLSFCINPNEIIYTKKELKSKYNFPNVNIMDVDIEWM
jgi:hypothetical protein